MNTIGDHLTGKFSKRSGDGTRTIKGFKAPTGLLDLSLSQNPVPSGGRPPRRKAESPTIQDRKEQVNEALKKHNPDKKKMSFEEYILNTFGKKATEIYGKKFLFDMYMAEVLGAKEVDLGNGKVGYVDSDGNKISKSDGVSAKAGAAAATAGLSSLWNAYMQNGEITAKDVVAAGTEGGLKYGKEYISNIDWIQDLGAGGQAVTGGLLGAASDVVGSLVTGKDIDAGKLATKGLATAGQQYIMNTAQQAIFDEAFKSAIAQGLTEEAAKQAGQQALASSAGNIGAVGAGVGSIANYGIMLSQGKKPGISNHMGTTGAMLGAQTGGYFGPIGAAIGAVVGGLAGTFGGLEFIESEYEKDRHLSRLADPNKGSVYWDEKEGRFKPNQITGVDRFKYYSKGGEHGENFYNPFPKKEEEQKWIQGLQAQLDTMAGEWNEAYKNYDSLDIATQMQVDALRGGDINTAVSGDGRLRIPGHVKDEWLSTGKGRVNLQGVDFELGGKEGRRSKWGSWKDEKMATDVNAKTHEFEYVDQANYQKTWDKLDKKLKSGGKLSDKQQKFYEKWKAGTYFLPTQGKGPVEGTNQIQGLLPVDRKLDSFEEWYKTNPGAEQYRGKKVQEGRTSMVGESTVKGLLNAPPEESIKQPVKSIPGGTASANGVDWISTPGVENYSQEMNENYKKKKAYEVYMQNLHDQSSVT